MNKPLALLRRGFLFAAIALKNEFSERAIQQPGAGFLDN